MRVLFVILLVLVVSGCNATITPRDRPVETVVLKSGEARVVITSSKIYFIIREEALNGKEVNNTLTEQDLIESGVLFTSYDMRYK